MTESNFLQFENTILASIAQLYQRSEESVNEDVINLQQWMKTQSHLPEILDDKRLRNFLILNKFSIEKSKESIDMYYTLRTVVPDLYENVNPKCSIMQEVVDWSYHVPGSRMTKDNYRMFFFKLRKNIADKLDPVNVVKCSFNVQELRLKEDVMCGDILIYDMEGITMTYMTKLTPSLFSKLHTVYSKIYSIPIKGVYIINNSSSFLGPVLNILKTFLKPKIFQRIHICKDTSILLEHFPRDRIPTDYGGAEKCLEELNEILKSKFVEYGQRFDQLDTLRVNEDLRPATLENDEILGFYGNFKKLNVD